MSISQLEALLPLPTEELSQILDYAATLSPSAAADYFGALLGDSPAVIEFISDFNSSLQASKLTASTSLSSSPAPPASSSAALSSSATPTPSGVPARPKKGKKQKPNLGVPQARKVENVAFGGGVVYQKKDHNDYIPSKPAPPSIVGPSLGGGQSSSTSNPASRSTTPTPAPAPASTSNLGGGSGGLSPNLGIQPPLPTSRSPSQSQGYLISDGPRKPKPTSTPGSGAGSASASAAPSRGPTPKPTKVNITGGVPMKGGASTALSDLDAAIRALEMSTNPLHTADPETRRCNCVATRHPLQKAAPNCTSCGKVVCVKEGLGPCTFCGAALLTSGEVQELIRELRDERGRERQAMHNDAQRRADSSRAAPPTYSKPRTGPGVELGPTPAEDEAARVAALAHRDKLLAFQADNAQRTTIRDEAADFDVSLVTEGGGGVLWWGTKEQRAKELRRQQEILREMEWNQKPEWEKRAMVVSIDVVGGKVVKKMAKIEGGGKGGQGGGQGGHGAGQSHSVVDGQLPIPLAEAVVGTTSVGGAAAATGSGSGTGAMLTTSSHGRNPLVGALIRPVYRLGPEEGSRGGAHVRRGWSRVQDLEGNEE